MTAISLENLPPRPHPIGHIEDVPIPPIESLKYLNDTEIIKAPFLVLHAQTSALVADIMARAIEEANSSKVGSRQILIDPDLVHGINVAYRAPRTRADAAKKQEADPNSNRFLRGHDDLDLATIMASQNNLPLPVIEGLMALQRERGFPHGTVGPNNRYQPGAIDWDVTLTQLASWLVGPGTIVPMRDRFKQLISAHANNHTSKNLTPEELIGYRDWAYGKITRFCNHIGIERKDYLDWLRNKIFTLPGTPVDAQAASDQLIYDLFDRKPNPGEYMPVNPTSQWLAFSIRGRKIGEKISGVDRRILSMQRLMPRIVANPQILEHLTRST